MSTGAAVEILHGDCLEQMTAMKASGRTFASIVTDPPYHLTSGNAVYDLAKTGAGNPRVSRRSRGGGFMGKEWDGGDIAFRPDTWRLALDMLEPGGMLAAFGGARTQHRMTCAIEDAGFEIRDCVMWLYGTGFPKSKALLKPAYEPIVLARKPGPLRDLGIDECRIGTTKEVPASSSDAPNNVYGVASPRREGRDGMNPNLGRFPANILHDGSDEVLEAFAAFGSKTTNKKSKTATGRGAMFGGGVKVDGGTLYKGDTGSAARFFYAAKASNAERAGASHPTIKPLSLMRWIVRLINRPGGAVLDPFAGSGTTGLACQQEGFSCTLVERENEYIDMIRSRMGFMEAAE